MGFRKTGTFHPADDVLVLTCDVREGAIGDKNGRRPQRHLRVTQCPSARSDAQRGPTPGSVS
jgi:hypothetical protein